MQSSESACSTSLSLMRHRSPWQKLSFEECPTEKAKSARSHSPWKQVRSPRPERTCPLPHIWSECQRLSLLLSGAATY